MAKEAWPPDYVAEFVKRQDRLAKLRSSPAMLVGAMEYYRTNPIAFIEHWCITYDPRNAGTEKPASMPFIPFERQRDLVDFLMAMLQGEECGLIEKCRDMGATWVSCAFSVWLWLFWPGAAIGWGSRKEQLVDKIGDPDSIFEKMRLIVWGLPREFWPEGFRPNDHMSYMRFVNPANGASITGEAGDNIGRGGRKLIYFKDESAHYERPEKIEAALGDNTRVQIDISSVNGLGNVFHRRRESGQEWQYGEPAHKGITNIFVMDWSDHPAKDQAWYDARRKKAVEDGLLHVFEQEVNRNYAAAVLGIVIPAEWVKTCIDAHLKIPGMEDGTAVAALDPADEGLDRHARCIRKGSVLCDLEERSEGDTGVATRWAVHSFKPFGTTEVQYDCVGVGAGCKSEINRMAGLEPGDPGKMPENQTWVPWNAGAAALDPEATIIPDDPATPKNKDYYANLKAQGWWQLRLRFERTFRVITEGVKFPPDQLISLPSNLPYLQQLRKELSQPTAGRSSNMRLMINKTPSGTRSPNLADCVMMAYWPIPGPGKFAVTSLRL